MRAKVWPHGVALSDLDRRSFTSSSGANHRMRSSGVRDLLHELCQPNWKPAERMLAQETKTGYFGRLFPQTEGRACVIRLVHRELLDRAVYHLRASMD
jgi:hypothetical protein